MKRVQRNNDNKKAWVLCEKKKCLKIECCRPRKKNASFVLQATTAILFHDMVLYFDINIAAVRH